MIDWSRMIILMNSEGLSCQEIANRAAVNKQAVYRLRGPYAKSVQPLYDTGAKLVALANTILTEGQLRSIHVGET